MKKFLIVFLFVQLASAQVTVVEDSILSPSLNKYARFFALLPDGYAKRQERYPVLYLLHGLGGDHSNWVKLTHLVRYAQEYRLIIITPDAGDGWYTNSPLLPNSNYEDLIIKDIIPAVDKKYRTIQTRFNRAIAGLSMGGYGAIKMGLKYPGKFFFVGAMSPSMQFPGALEDSVIIARWSKTSTMNLRALFGEKRSDFWNDNDVFAAAERTTSKTLPYFYLSIGSQDGIIELIGLTHDLAGVFRRKGIAFEMHEYPGGHDWKFWDQEIKTILQRMTDISGKR